MAQRMEAGSWGASSTGWHSVLAKMGNDLFEVAAQLRLTEINAKLYFDLFHPKP